MATQKTNLLSNRIFSLVFLMPFHFVLFSLAVSWSATHMTVKENCMAKHKHILVLASASIQCLCDRRWISFQEGIIFIKDRFFPPAFDWLISFLFKTIIHDARGSFSNIDDYYFSIYRFLIQRFCICSLPEHTILTFVCQRSHRKRVSCWSYELFFSLC